MNYDGRFRELGMHEIACKCGCGFNRIPLALAEVFMTIRREFGEGIRITSGCRCESHNRAVGSVSNSHVKGQALDIAVFRRTGNEETDRLAFERLGLCIGKARSNDMPINVGINRLQMFYHIDINFTGGRWNLVFGY